MTNTKINKRHDDKINQYVGQKIQQLRKLKSVTVFQLADALSVSHQQVRKYEIGTNSVSLTKLIETALFLNVSIGSFFDGIDKVIDHTFSEGDITTQELVSTTFKTIQHALRVTRNMQHDAYNMQQDIEILRGWLKQA